MAKYHTDVTNSRGKTIGTSGNKEGQTAHIKTWTHGVKIRACEMGGVETLQIFVTSGSSPSHNDEYLGEVVLQNGKPFFKRSKNWQQV